MQIRVNSGMQPLRKCSNFKTQEKLKVGRPASPRPNTTARHGKTAPPAGQQRRRGGRFLPRRHERMAIEPPHPTAPSAPQPAFLLPPGDAPRAARAQPERPQQARRDGCGGPPMHHHRWALPATMQLSRPWAWHEGVAPSRNTPSATPGSDHWACKNISSTTSRYAQV
jgi:hypothetical protein